MATTAITAEELDLDTASADLATAGGGTGNGIVAATPADGWVISAAGGLNERLLLRLSADATGDTFTVKAGDNPPALRAGLGDKTYVLAANDVKYVAIDLSRHKQNDGTVIVTCVDAGSVLAALILPKGVEA